MTTEARVVSDLPVPPGELLIETLEVLGLRQVDAARRMGRPAQAINEIVKGKKEITAETALQFERVLGVPAHVWLGLEATYRQALARRADIRRLARDATRAAAFPYAAMARLGWLEKTRETSARIEQLLRFFGVGSLARVPAVAAEAAYRVARACHSAPQRPSAPALAAWFRKGEIEAATIQTARFSGARLRETLPVIRALTASAEEGWADTLRDRLARCGVALVVVPHLPGTRAHGATRWLTPRKALVQMSLRGRWADIFWFSLFHELGHLLLHGRTPLFVEWNDAAHDGRENEADAFARDHLITPKEWAAFLGAHPRPSTRTTEAFARRLGIAAGIVVGRLHHEEHLPHSDLNGLRRQLDWPAFRAGAGYTDHAAQVAFPSR